MTFGTPTPIAVAVVSHDGQFLVGPRPPGVPLAGFWEFPGGKLQADESPAEAAVRECREETGLSIRVVGEYPSATHDYAHGRLQLHFFACEPLDPAATPTPPFRWVEAAALAELHFPAANEEVLRMIASET